MRQGSIAPSLWVIGSASLIIALKSCFCFLNEFLSLLSAPIDAACCRSRPRPGENIVYLLILLPKVPLGVLLSREKWEGCVWTCAHSSKSSPRPFLGPSSALPRVFLRALAPHLHVFQPTRPPSSSLTSHQIKG